MTFPKLFQAVFLAASVAGWAGPDAGFVVQYFSAKTVSAVASALCSRENNFRLFKKFSERKIKFDLLNLERSDERKTIDRLTSKSFKLGVLLDLGCPRTLDLLRAVKADENQLFSSGNALTLWLIMTRTHLSKESFERLSEIYAPKVVDPIEFLIRPYRNKKNEKYLLEINKKVNADFIMNYQNIRHKRRKQNGNQTELDDLFKMNISFGNEIALAMREPPYGDGVYRLFALHRATAESRLEARPMGRIGQEGGLVLLEDRKKPNLGNAVLRAASAMIQPEAFTTMDDLAARESDLWPKMTFHHVSLLAEDLNFRIVVRFFDDYGWQTNGSFGHLVGSLQQREADLGAAGLLLRADRHAVLDFLACPFRLQTGILFREPSLSSVTNVFLLPFSEPVWVSVGVVVALTALFLRCCVFAAEIRLLPDESSSGFFDVFICIVGIVCQQGFSNAPKSFSARISIVAILLTSGALFSSYSACIVALLQSSSPAISTVADITESDFEVGIQSNFPFFKVLIEEASHPVLKKFYERKVLFKGKKAFCGRREGIEKMRVGMFAFEGELTASYKLIGETYDEKEKCGIRELDLVPKPFICMVVRKRSPYREAFTRRLIWQQETGLFDRSWHLWTDRKPKCEVARLGFTSIGLAAFEPALEAFACGIAVAVAIFVLELLPPKTFLPVNLKKTLKKRTTPKSLRSHFLYRQGRAPPHFHPPSFFVGTLF